MHLLSSLRLGSASYLFHPILSISIYSLNSLYVRHCSRYLCYIKEQRDGDSFPHGRQPTKIYISKYNMLDADNSFGKNEEVD